MKSMIDHGCAICVHGGMRLTRLLPTLFVLPLVAHAIACKKADDAATPPTGDSEIIGGVDAKSAALDAIGALVYLNPQTQKQEELCTATLITPKVVLTAKHCAMEKTTEQVDGGP